MNTVWGWSRMAALVAVSLVIGCAQSSMPPVSEVTALSEHYIAVGFEAPVGPVAADPAHYTITGPGGAALPVTAAELMPDGRRILLSAGAQSDVEYRLAVGGETIAFAGSAIREPALETAIPLSNTQLLLTFSSTLDRVTAETAGYYRILDLDASADIDLSITDAELGADGRTVVLSTSPQANQNYAIEATNIQASYTCADGASFDLDVTAQGEVCTAGLRPTGVHDETAQFRITARTRVTHNQELNALAEGSPGHVITTAQGAGVQGTNCGGSLGVSGSTDSRDEELIFTPDEAVPAAGIHIGLGEIDFNVDAPVIFLSSTAADGFDHTIMANQVAAAFTSAGGQRGTVDMGAIATLPAGLMVNMLKIRETNGDITVESVCGMQYRGTLIDPTRNRVDFQGTPPVDTAGPQILSVVSTSDTTLLVTFSEAIGPDSVDPAAFTVVPGLAVLDAVLTQYGTQVLLTTMPQAAGVNYEVVVNGITDLAGNAVASGVGDSAAFVYEGGPAALDASTLPRVIGAASTGNTTVVVTFSKPMGDSALVAGNYVIVQQNVVPEAAGLVVLGDPAPVFVDGSGRTAVTLTTLPQSQVEYLLVAVNVLDQAGNQLASRTPLVDPTTAVFWGAGVVGQPDVDGDGLPDNEEQRGWVVTVVLTNGDIVQRDVTSDPFVADTDGDGISDYEEQRRSSDPRDADTDGDLLPDFEEKSRYFSSMNRQDSDEDGIDDLAEVTFFHTSPIFEDTDGDGLADGDEVVIANRHPLIADLARSRIDIGDMNLTLDTRFSFTDTQGESRTTQESVSTSLTQSESEAFGFSDSDTTSETISESFKIGVQVGIPFEGVKFGFENNFGYSYTDSETVTLTQNSAQSAQEAYQESLTTSESVDETRSITRQVVGANMQVNLTVKNEGDIAFSISNLEISALQQDPRDRGRLVPIATLTPAGANNVFNLGPFVPERGPFIFESREVFPALIEDLLKSPRGLIFKVANFDITDEFDRNFAFASQAVNDQTAGLTIDYGNGETESYRIATALDCSDYPMTPCISFDATGQPTGITMGYAMRHILGMPLNPDPAMPEAIVDGGDGVADTIAVGDDVQVTPVSGLVGRDRIIVSPGLNGVIDSTASGDDTPGLLTGYTTEADGDGVQRLTRVRSIAQDVQSGTLWRIISNRRIDENTSFDDVVLRGGDNVSLALFQDRDGDGLSAREEFLHRSSDRLLNSDGTVIVDGGNGQVDTMGEGDDLELYVAGARITPFAQLIGPGGNGTIDAVLNDVDGDGTPDAGGDDKLLVINPGMDDTPGDTLPDFLEVREGWVIEVVGQLPYRSYSDPSIADSDGDGLLDDVEFERGTDARKLDTDDDRIDDHAEITVHLTDPLNPDTDMDGLEDGIELALGANPLDPSDAAQFRDTDRDGLTDAEELAFGSNEFEPDTDGDGLPDLLEQLIMSDPTSNDSDGDALLDFDEFDGTSPQSISPSLFNQFNQACAAADRCSYSPQGSQLYGTSVTSTDTDGDTLSDFAEVTESWVVLACVGADAQLPLQVQSSPKTADGDVDFLNDAAERAAGTDPGNADTDGDGLFDGDDAKPLGCDKAVTLTIEELIVGADDCDRSPNDAGGSVGGSDACGAGAFLFSFGVEVNNSASGGGTGVASQVVTVPVLIQEGTAGNIGLSFSGTLNPGGFIVLDGTITEVDPTGGGCGAPGDDDGCCNGTDGNEVWTLAAQTITFADAQNGAMLEVTKEAGCMDDCYCDDTLVITLDVD